MKHYRVTEDLRNRLNDYLGIEIFGDNQVGKDFYQLENYNVIGSIAPEKARLLMATLFPEEMDDPYFFEKHIEEIKLLAKRLNVENEVPHRRVCWFDHMVKREMLTGKTYLDDKEIWNRFVSNW